MKCLKPYISWELKRKWEDSLMYGNNLLWQVVAGLVTTLIWKLEIVSGLEQT